MAINQKFQIDISNGGSAINFFSINAHTILRKNYKFLQTLKLSFKNDKVFQQDGYLCDDCSALNPPVFHKDGQEELLTCLGNMDLRIGKNLSDPKLEAEYYRAIIERRTQRRAK